MILTLWYRIIPAVSKAMEVNTHVCSLISCWLSDNCQFVSNFILNCKWNTVECRYNAVQYCKILHEWLQELRQNINQMLDPQKTPHTSPLRASYRVSFVNICEKIDRAITAPHCIDNEFRNGDVSEFQSCVLPQVYNRGLHHASERIAAWRAGDGTTTQHYPDGTQHPCG